MQRITSSSDQVALNSATQVQARWGSYEVNWCSVKDAYASSQNIFSGVARAALEVFANFAKTIANVAICVGNKVYNLLHPQAAATSADDQQQSLIADLADSDVFVESSTSVSISYEPTAQELEAEEAVASVVDEATVMLDNELPDLDVLEELPELQASKNWTKTHVAAAAALGTAVVVGGVLGARAAGYPQAYDFFANNADKAWQGMQGAGTAFAQGARDAGNTAWAWTGEPIGKAASATSEAASNAYTYVKNLFSSSYTG